MATYNKQSSYTIYPGMSVYEFIDFLYVDGTFFQNNLPITTAVLDVSVTRSGDMGMAGLAIYIVTYSGGVVGQRLVAGGTWNIGDKTFTFHQNLSSVFYGMGLNPLDIRITPQMMYSPMVWTVNYSLGVS
jgi:hypothetical protein